MDNLLEEISRCSLCESHLELGVNPVISASVKSKIAVVGQAPGRIVHNTGIPWDDQSGIRLRTWLGVDESVFYDKEVFALVPIGFCYPGSGSHGDLPPRKECAPKWHQLVFDQMPSLSLILLVGNYAQKYYLRNAMKSTLTETVNRYDEYLPTYWPLPHPSPRNNIWLKKNPWFNNEIVPNLQKTIKQYI